MDYSNNKALFEQLGGQMCDDAHLEDSKFFTSVGVVGGVMIVIGMIHVVWSMVLG